MFGGSSRLRKEYAAVIKQIENGERHKPRHQQPRSIRTGPFAGFATPAHEVIFEEFEWFGAQMNFNTTEPWSIEETPDTHVREPGADTPEVGRTYRVYYNAAKLGRLQITLGHSHDLIFNNSRENFIKHRSARALIELHHLRFVPYMDAYNFVFSVEQLLGEEHEAAKVLSAAAVTAALSGYLWESVREEDVALTFDHYVHGPYEVLRHTNAHWKAHGIDPFEKWGGDRPWRGE